MNHQLALCVIGCIVIIKISYKNLPIEIYHPPFIGIPSLLTFTCLSWLLTPHFYSVLQLHARSLEVSLKKKNLRHICFIGNFVKSSRIVFRQCPFGWPCTSNFWQRFRCSLSNCSLVSSKILKDNQKITKVQGNIFQLRPM